MPDNGEEELLARLDGVRKDVNALSDEIARVIIGQEGIVRLMLAACFARGHCLLVGVPGLAKTAMVRALAGALRLDFKRIQFTPDLMPSDITGTHMLMEEDGRRALRFVPGPLFANVILADEVNRTPPKTQAALLEAMQERQATVANETRRLPDPFLVIATQNPIEQEGTYELPEAQLDRFMFHLEIGYPSLQEEETLLSRGPMPDPLPVSPVMSRERVLEIQELVRRIHVSNYLVSYAARLIRSTRPGDPFAPPFVRNNVEWGAGPRAGQCLLEGARALAAMDGRTVAAPRDLQAVILPCLRHRVAINFRGQAEGIRSADILRKLVETIPEPKG